MPTHRELDDRSRALHTLVAEKIRQDPARLDHARAILARWRAIVCANTQSYLLEWERILGSSTDEILAVAVEDSQRADALRQCSPLACVLSPRERWAFLREWSRQHDESSMKGGAQREEVPRILFAHLEGEEPADLETTALEREGDPRPPE